jgi:hypothetical protein
LSPTTRPCCEHHTSASSTSSSSIPGGAASCSDIRPRASTGGASGAAVGDPTTAHLAGAAVIAVVTDNRCRTFPVPIGCRTRKRAPWLAPREGTDAAAPLGEHVVAIAMVTAFNLSAREGSASGKLEGDRLVQTQEREAG